MMGMRFLGLPLASMMAFVLAVMLVTATHAEDPTAAPIWTVDPSTSAIIFEGEQTGKKFEGRFGEFAAEIRFDPDNLGGSSINAVISTASAKTGDRQRDAALPGGDWFAAKDFPQAVFSSTEITNVGEGAYEATGSLTIRDNTQPVTLPFTLQITGDDVHAESALTLVRSDFGVGQGEFSTGKWVGLEVGLSITIDATRVAE